MTGRSGSGEWHGQYPMHSAYKALVANVSGNKTIVWKNLWNKVVPLK